MPRHILYYGEMSLPTIFSLKTPRLTLVVLAWLMAIAVFRVAGQAETPGSVCSIPAAACSSTYSFAAYQLPFRIKRKLVFGKTYKSGPFYSVVLKSVRANTDPDCTHISEKERLEAQALFPDRKVFASRFSCAEELVLYTNVDQDHNFLAVYAGTTAAEAKRTLTKAKAMGRYPQANIRRMEVVLEFST